MTENSSHERSAELLSNKAARTGNSWTRSWAAPAALALAVGGAIAAVSAITDKADPSPVASVVPASAPHLKQTPARMAAVIDDRATTVLGNLVDGKAAKFVPLTDEWNELPTTKVEAASAAYTDFGSKADGRVWRVFVSGSTGDSDTTPSCDSVSKAIGCAILDTPTGLVQHTVVTAIEDPDFPDSYTLVEWPDTLTSSELQKVRIESSVRFVNADGSITSATETAYSPSKADATAFLASPEQLASLASDPQLRW